ncbi:hypothetical protein ROHU_024071 [Labeo rohita]|uniref:Uncharacterized protein n=1 Tax=Labeo rohita TaxID=84645 RepID=A0A498MPD3_LABRO|nr:hypothetical protein ROHU_024071 [Labeo rohita]
MDSVPKETGEVKVARRGVDKNVVQLQTPASAPAVGHGRTCDMTDADEMAACVAGADVTGAGLQPCLGNATSTADTAHPKICRKLPGDGKSTAEWSTNVANELGQILITALTCEESQGKMWLMTECLIESLLDLHIKESRHPERKVSPDEWVKDLLLKYVRLFPQVSCHLEINVDRAIYGQGRFRSFTFLEMWQWYSLHKTLQSDPQADTDHERKMALEAYCSVKQWLVMKEEDITTKSLKRFKRYILDKENPPQNRAPPAAAASSSSSGSKSDGGWGDDALLVEALTSFERQGSRNGSRIGSRIRKCGRLVLMGSPAQTLHG